MDVITLSGRMNSAKDLVVMLPTVRVSYPEGQIYLIQENARCTMPELCKNDITFISWPSKSADLNFIENLWGQMVLNWDPSNVRSTQNFKELVHSTWESVRGGDLCSSLVNSMRSRLQQVIDNEGR